MPTTDHIIAYSLHLQTNKHRAATTVRSYVQELTQLVQRDVDLESAESIAVFVSSGIDGKPLEPATRNRRLSIVRGFIAYLVDQGELTTDHSAGIDRAKVPRGHKTPPEVHDLCRALGILAMKPHSWKRVRDEVILKLLFYTGLRITELHQFDLPMLDLGHGLVRGIRLKGGEIKDVILPTRGTEALREWLSLRPGSTDPALFLNRNGKRLSVRMMEKRLKQIGEQAGIKVPLTPHAVRRAHATELDSENTALSVIQASLNHSDIATTVRYIYRRQERVRQAREGLPELRADAGGA